MQMIKCFGKNWSKAYIFLMKLCVGEKQSKSKNKANMLCLTTNSTISARILKSE